MSTSQDIFVAVRCLQQLGSARALDWIARAEGLDEAATGVLLGHLAEAGLISRVGGDYRLARPESEIRVDDVQHALRIERPLGRWGRTTLAQLRRFEDAAFEAGEPAVAA